MLFNKLKKFGLVVTSITIGSFLLTACGQTSASNEILLTNNAKFEINSENYNNSYIETSSHNHENNSSDITESVISSNNEDIEESVSEESNIEEYSIEKAAIEESVILETLVDETSFETLTDEEVPTAVIKADGLRDNTPVCYVPVASGITVYSNALAEIDASNTSEGYIMVNYKGINPKVKLQITGSNGVTYTYNLQGGYETFPLSAGSGAYKIAVYENVTGNQYATALSQTITANVTNPFGAYLYPNQYVNFNASNSVVAKAMQLAESCTSDLDVVAKVYNYVSTITYDHSKANTVQSGYTPNVDLILQSGTGICLDYASVMASMLRSQNIPTRLEVGYAGNAYHAWISTYITDIGWVNGIIQFDGINWSLMDPTFAANSSEKTLKNFIGDGSNYKTKYIY